MFIIALLGSHILASFVPLMDLSSSSDPIPRTANHHFHSQLGSYSKRKEVSSDSVKFDDDKFTSCTGSSVNGGAIYAEIINSFEVTDCKFTSCKAKGGSSAGGAIYVIPRTAEANLAVSFRDSKFTSCTSRGHGGAIYAKVAKKFTTRDCKFTSCNADGSLAYGGAIYIIIGRTDSEMEATFRDTKFTSCTSEGHGGAIYAEVADEFQMRDCKLTSCTAGENGGGIYFASASSALILSSESNDADSDSIATFRDCVFMSCKAKASGDVGHDLFFANGTAVGLTKDSFYDCGSTSGKPRVFVEGQGDKSEFLPDYHVHLAIILGAVFGGIALAVLIITLCCCCCCPCCPIGKRIRRRNSPEKETETQTLLVNTSADPTAKDTDKVDPAARAIPHMDSPTPSAPNQLPPPYQTATKEQYPAQPPPAAQQPSVYPVYSPAFEPPTHVAGAPRHIIAM